MAQLGMVGVGGTAHSTVTCGSEPPGPGVEGWPPGPATSSISFSSRSREPWISREMVSNSCLSWEDQPIRGAREAGGRRAVTGIVMAGFDEGRGRKRR